MYKICIYKDRMQWKAASKVAFGVLEGKTIVVYSSGFAIDTKSDSMRGFPLATPNVGIQGDVLPPSYKRVWVPFVVSNTVQPTHTNNPATCNEKIQDKPNRIMCLQQS